MFGATGAFFGVLSRMGCDFLCASARIPFGVDIKREALPCLRFPQKPNGCLPHAHTLHAGAWFSRNPTVTRTPDDELGPRQPGPPRAWGAVRLYGWACLWEGSLSEGRRRRSINVFGGPSSFKGHAVFFSAVQAPPSQAAPHGGPRCA